MMSYNIELGVKIDGTDLYAVVARPSYDNPTYNVGKMLRVAMDWDFVQGDWYKCQEVLPNIERGVRELHVNEDDYRRYEDENGWETVGDARDALESLRDCIYETARYHVPIEHLWVRW